MTAEEVTCTTCQDRGVVTINPSHDHLKAHEREADKTFTLEELAEHDRQSRAETWDEAIATVFSWWSTPSNQRPAVIRNPYGKSSDD